MIVLRAAIIFAPKQLLDASLLRLHRLRLRLSSVLLACEVLIFALRGRTFLTLCELFSVLLDELELLDRGDVTRVDLIDVIIVSVSL